MMRKLNRRGKKEAVKKRQIIIFLTTVVSFLVVLTAMSHYSSLEQKIPKRDPNEYFQFKNISALGYHPKNSSNVMRIQMLYFEFVPVGGDAHNVVIFTEGMSNPNDYYYSHIEKGKKQNVEIIFPPNCEIQIRKQQDKYPIKIRIRSDEAEGYVTLWLREEDILLSKGK